MLSRDQLFQKSFDDFMNNQIFPNLHEWNLKNVTKHAKSNIHEYEFTVQKQYTMYSIDRGLNNCEQVIENQEVPELKQFNNLFYDYVKNHQLTIGNKLVSYVDVSEDSKITDTGDLYFKIEIKYYKSHYPYPTEHTSINDVLENNTILEKNNLELENKNAFLKNKIREKNRTIKDLYEQIEEQRFALSYKNQRISILEDEIRANRIKTYTTMNRIEKEFCKLYDKLAEDAKEDCPVCFNRIVTNVLVVPKCCHFICIECFDRCPNCPICRDDF